MRFGIVSSVAESCGNASFTQVIIDSLNESGNHAIGVALNLNLTQSSDPNLVKMANQHVSEIAEELKGFDAVNLQYEPGLYGPNSTLIYRRLKTLVLANPHCVVTIHSTRLFTLAKEPLIRQTLKFVVRAQLRQAIGHIGAVKNNRRIAKNNRRVIDLFIKHNAKLIVHTRSSQLLIRNFWNYKDVYVHPLKFVDFGECKSNRGKWVKSLKLEEEDVLLGVFGYISKYKGHETAIEALRFLPTNYKLLVVGRQHPQTIREHQDIDAFLAKILYRIQEISLENGAFKDRIIFINELPDSEFNSLASSVDFAWLPYLEVGQDGSGIASILFELAPRVIASNAKSFEELIALEPGYSCDKFDIGNYLELASKTLRYSEKRDRNRLKFSKTSQTELYLTLLTGK